MTIEVDVEGRRYIEDRDTTAVIAGSKSRATKFTEHWTFALDGDAAQPWRIARGRAPLGHALARWTRGRPERHVGGAGA